MGYPGYPIVQDPDDALDYTIDWSDFLEGDTISAFVVTFPSVGGAPTEAFPKSNTTTTTTFWVTGGTSHTAYIIKSKITTTTNAREKERDIIIYIKDSQSVLAHALPTTLLDVRQMFVESSGRVDLVADWEAGNFSDNGANVILNEAQRWLDRMLHVQKQDKFLYKPLASGESIITFEQSRYIKEVWVNKTTASTGRTKLEKLDTNKMREDYPLPTFAEMDTGVPLFWTPYISSLSPENPSAAIEAITLSGSSPVSVQLTAHRFVAGDVVFFRNVLGTTELNGNTYTVTVTDGDNITLDGTDSTNFTAWTSSGTTTKLFTLPTDTDLLVLGDTAPQRSIIIMPPASGAYTVEVLCAWHSPKLLHDAHTSYWTVEHPELLVRAAQRILEVDHHRNSTGRRDFEEPLRQDVQDIYHDFIAENSSGHHSLYKMKG